MNTRAVRQRAAGDCGIAALAMLLKLSYEDVYVVMAEVDQKRRGRMGTWPANIREAAAKLGVTLRARRKFDMESMDGVLGIKYRQAPTHPGHWVTLLDGIILDPTDLEIANYDDYLQRNNAVPHCLVTSD